MEFRTYASNLPPATLPLDTIHDGIIIVQGGQVALVAPANLFNSGVSYIATPSGKTYSVTVDDSDGTPKFILTEV